VLALVGWTGVPPPAEAWTGATTAGAPVVLAHATRGPAWRCTSAAFGTLRGVVAGRFHNRAALVDDLGGAVHDGPLDDAAVLLRLWTERGSACLTALRGAFTLAVWDARRQRLSIARDQLGLVP
jgi:asparagine synthetase B (glutamine-hydrolysing)